MKILKENKDYKIIEFDDDDIDNDNDLIIINKLIMNDIKYEYIDDDENIIKIYHQ